MVFRFSIWVLIFRFSSPIHLFGIWYLKIGGLIYLIFGIGTSKSLFIQQKYQNFMPVQYIYIYIYIYTKSELLVPQMSHLASHNLTSYVYIEGVPETAALRAAIMDEKINK